MQPGILLINLGTPEAPETRPVRRYLAQFLSDGRVLDLHPVARQLLLRLIILPRRPARSAEAYRQIWLPQGSPLLVHGQALTEAVQDAFPDAKVALAMRYGQPSLAQGLEKLAGCSPLIAVPLYPHYAASTVASTRAELYRLLSEGWDVDAVRVAPIFYDHPDYIDAMATIAEEQEGPAPDHTLMSFHGLPERHLRKSDGTGHCLAGQEGAEHPCCAAPCARESRCYRAQCVRTAEALAARLGLAPDAWSIAFQSRLGRDPWIQPYAEERIEALAQSGVKRLRVFCPAFVADCLETVEEIGQRGAELFEEAGGDELMLVPGLNAHPAWVEALAGMIRPLVA